MKIESEKPKEILESIEPDNLENIKSYVEENKLITEFRFKNVRQAIASLNDLIKCIDVSKEIFKEWEK